MTGYRYKKTSILAAFKVLIPWQGSAAGALTAKDTIALERSSVILTVPSVQTSVSDSMSRSLPSTHYRHFMT